jgi:hypothetical protein
LSKFLNICLAVIALVSIMMLMGCAESIVHGESIKTTSAIINPKPADEPVEILYQGNQPDRTYTIVGKIVVRSYVLEKGINELKDQARQLGGDAVIDVRYERKFSADYFQDLFNITGDAVIWNE